MLAIAALRRARCQMRLHLRSLPAAVSVALTVALVLAAFPTGPSVAGSRSVSLAVGQSTLPGCKGRDLMARLAQKAPRAHAGILERAHRVANAQGRFWIVEKEGARPSYLFGTIHSTEAAALGLSAAVARALDSARLLFVELSPNERARLETRLAEDPDYALIDDGPTLSERLGGTALSEAESVLAERGFALDAAERLKPWVLLSMIGIPVCEQMRIAAGMAVLDDAIAARAETAGIPVRGLETYEDAFAAFEDLSDSEMNALLIDGFMTGEVEEDLRRTLESLYRAEEIAAIMEFNIWYSESRGRIDDSRASGSALERALIAGRNQRWMDALEDELETGGVFAAFGALHLPGDMGVVQLLRERGFTVERLSL